MSQVRTMSCKAETDCVLLTLGRDQLTKVLGDQIKDIFIRNNINWAFERSEIFSKLTAY